MSDAELTKKHAAERFVNAAFEANQAEYAREQAAARVSKCNAARDAAEKAIIEAFAPSGGNSVFIRYGSDKLLIVSATHAKLVTLVTNI